MLVKTVNCTGIPSYPSQNVSRSEDKYNGDKDWTRESLTTAGRNAEQVHLCGNQDNLCFLYFFHALPMKMFKKLQEAIWWRERSTCEDIGIKFYSTKEADGWPTIISWHRIQVPGLDRGRDKTMEKCTPFFLSVQQTWFLKFENVSILRITLASVHDQIQNITLVQKLCPFSDYHLIHFNMLPIVN